MCHPDLIHKHSEEVCTPNGLLDSDSNLILLPAKLSPENHLALNEWHKRVETIEYHLGGQLESSVKSSFKIRMSEGAGRIW